MGLTTKINATLILEILGRPKEHLVETLENFIKKMGEEKGVKVKDKKIKEPTLFKEHKNLFTTFAEIDVEVEDILILSGLIFNYMPAHVEITSPEKVNLSNNKWNEVLNELTRRLHAYDEVVKVIQSEKAILEKKLKESEGGKKS